MSKTPTDLCNDCKKLVGAGRHADPHAHLVCTKKVRVPSIMGAADEAWYLCNTCGHEWLHETGSAGLGWRAIS